MCGRLRINKNIVLPRQKIAIHSDSLPIFWGTPRNVAEGYPPFARIETLQERWLSKGGWEERTLTVEDFAELDRNHQPRWAGAPARIKVLCRKIEGGAFSYYSIVIVTRQSTPEEVKRYDHDRMPVTVQESAA